MLRFGSRLDVVLARTVNASGAPSLKSQNPIAAPGDHHALLFVKTTPTWSFRVAFEGFSALSGTGAALTGTNVISGTTFKSNGDLMVSGVHGNMATVRL